MSKRYKDYVCPVCFMQLSHCTCKVSPWELIQIDAKIQHAVKVLNAKGYYTKYSCEGHYSGKNCVVEGYILFDITPNDYPQGWRKSKNRIYYHMKPMNKKEFIEEQEKNIEALNKWADELKKGSA